MLIRISVSNLGLVWINIFHHSISVTHHSSFKIPYPFGTITHLLLLNIFHTICGSHTCYLVLFFFFFFPIPKLTVNLFLKKKKKKNRSPTTISCHHPRHFHKCKSKKDDQFTTQDHTNNPKNSKNKKN